MVVVVGTQSQVYTRQKYQVPRVGFILCIKYLELSLYFIVVVGTKSRVFRRRNLKQGLQKQQVPRVGQIVVVGTQSRVYTLQKQYKVPKVGFILYSISRYLELGLQQQQVHRVGFILYISSRYIEFKFLKSVCVCRVCRIREFSYHDNYLNSKTFALR